MLCMIRVKAFLFQEVKLSQNKVRVYSVQSSDNPINKFWKDDVPAQRWQNEK